MLLSVSSSEVYMVLRMWIAWAAVVGGVSVSAT